MTGLNLEAFLHLLRADLGAWAGLGFIALLLALLSWTSWGSRRALRKCLVLSIVVHLGLALTSRTWPILRLSATRPGETESSGERIRQIRVRPQFEGTSGAGGGPADGRGGHRLAAWDRPGEALALADPSILPAPPEAPSPELARQPPTPGADVPEPATPEVSPPEPSAPEARIDPEPAEPSPAAPPAVAPSGPEEVASALVRSREVEAPLATPAPRRIHPDRPDRQAPSTEIARAERAPTALPEAHLPPLESPRAGPEVRPIEPDAPPPESSPVASAEAVETPRAARVEPEALALALPGEGILRERLRRPGAAVTAAPSELPARPRPPIPAAPAPAPRGEEGSPGGLAARPEEPPLASATRLRDEPPAVLADRTEVPAGAIRLPRPAPPPAPALAEAD
ncbi:MAG TPA: hypothetical protein VF590_16540, partial [Isosphaeraceae bacterium]